MATPQEDAITALDAYAPVDQASQVVTDPAAVGAENYPEPRADQPSWMHPNPQTGPVSPVAAALAGAYHAAPGAQIDASAPPSPLPGPAQGPTTSPQAARPTPRPRPDDVQAAAAQEDQALAAAGAARAESTKAAQAAEASHIQARADVEAGYADALAQADQAHQVAREAAHRQAAAETADWMARTDEIVKREPTPGRWWNSQSGFGKSLWLLGLMGSTLATGGTPGVKNFASDLILKEVDQDMADQKARQGRELEAQKVKGGMMEKEHAQTLSDLADDHTSRVARLGVLEKAMELRTTAPGDQDAAAAKAEAVAWLGAQKAAVAKDRYDKAVTMKEGAATRAMHITTAMITDQRERDLAELSASVKLAEAGLRAKGDKDYGTIDQASTGVQVVNAAGQARPMSVRKDFLKDAREKATAASAQFQDLKTIRDRLSQDGITEEAVMNDPVLNQAFERLRFSTTREANPNQRLTNTEFQHGGAIALGFDLDTPKDRAKMILGHKDDVLGLLDRTISSFPSETQRELQGRYGEDLGEGEKVIFNPQDVQTAPPTAPTYKETEAKISGQAQAGPPAPHSSDEYRAAAAREASLGPGTALPVLTGKLQGDVTTAIDAFKDAAPSRIRLLETQALGRIPDKTAAEQTARAAIVAASEDAAKKAQERVDEAAKAITRGQSSGARAVTTGSNLAGGSLAQGLASKSRILSATEADYYKAAKTAGLKPSPEVIEDIKQALRAMEE